jgi:hypothetical protein
MSFPLLRTYHGFSSSVVGYPDQTVQGANPVLVHQREERAFKLGWNASSVEVDNPPRLQYVFHVSSGATLMRCGNSPEAVGPFFPQPARCRANPWRGARAEMPTPSLTAIRAFTVLPSIVSISHRQPAMRRLGAIDCVIDSQFCRANGQGNARLSGRFVYNTWEVIDAQANSGAIEIIAKPAWRICTMIDLASPCPKSSKGSSHAPFLSNFEKVRRHLLSHGIRCSSFTAKLNVPLSDVAL